MLVPIIAVVSRKNPTTLRPAVQTAFISRRIVSLRASVFIVTSFNLSPAKTASVKATTSPKLMAGIEPAPTPETRGRG
jgi:hypothetical protein